MANFCYLWSTDITLWIRSGWTWGECQIVQDCLTWAKANRWWSNSPQKWSECEKCLTWASAGRWWKMANWKWSECSSSIGPIPPKPVISASLQPFGVDAMTLQQPWLEEPWSPYRAADEQSRKRLIRLICKVKGVEYNEQKEHKNFRITADDIKLIVKKIAGIDLDLKLED